MNRRNDLIISAMIFLVCLPFLFMTNNIRPLGAANYPKMLLLIVMGFALIMGIGAFLRPKDREVAKKPSPHVLRPYFVYLIALVYVIMVSIIGYFIATSLFLFSFMLYLGRRQYVQMALIIGGFNFAIWYVFVVRLHVLIPMGILFER